MAPSAYVWLLLAAVYFIVPLYATLDFSLKKNAVGAPCCTLHNYGWVIHNGDFWHTIKISFILALETIVISLLLFVPTIYWVHLKVPKLRPVLAFMALVPFVVPPIVMVVGLLKTFKGTPHWFYGTPWGFLATAYVILACGMEPSRPCSRLDGPSARSPARPSSGGSASSKAETSRSGSVRPRPVRASSSSAPTCPGPRPSRRT